MPSVRCGFPPAAPVLKGRGVFQSRVPSTRCVFTPAAPVPKGAYCIREPGALGEVCVSLRGVLLERGGP